MMTGPLPMTSTHFGRPLIAASGLGASSGGYAVEPPDVVVVPRLSGRLIFDPGGLGRGGPGG